MPSASIRALLSGALLLLCAARPGPVQEPETVVPGPATARAALYEPHRARVEQTVRKEGTIQSVTNFLNELSRTESQGEEQFHIVTHGDGWDLEVFLERKSFALRSYDMQLSNGGFTRIELDGTRVTGERRDSGEAPAQALDQDLGTLAIPSGMVDGVVGALPLRVGYSARIPTFQPGRPEVEWKTYRVVRTEPVRVGEREVQAWVVEEQGRVTGTLWLVDEPPYMVRWILRSPSGAELELTQELVS